MRNGTTLYGTTSTVQRLAVGGGGYVTGLDVSSDGTLVCRTDTLGGYVRSPGARIWTPILQMGVNVTEANGKYNYPKGAGAYDVAIAWSNSSVLAICSMGYIYTSTDKGVTITKTALAYSANYDANGVTRMNRKRLLIDPGGTTVLAFFDPTPTTGGLQVSTNFGTTWARNAQVPASTSNTSGCLAVDRSSSVVSSSYQTVYASNGATIWKSTTGWSGTFAQITGYTGGAVCSMIASAGNLFVADKTNVYKWNGTAWSTVSSSQGIESLALNYADITKLVGFNDGGGYIASSDSGTTWTTLGGTVSRSAADVPWLATTREDYMTHGMAVFDPANAGQLIVSEGIGVWKLPSAPLTQSPSVTWQSMTLGIEQMVSMNLIVTATGRVLYACQDRTFTCFDKAKVTVYPRNQGTYYGAPNTLSNTAIDHGTGIDFAIDSESYLVGVSSTNQICSISRDGGKTWTATPTLPANITSSNVCAGSVAVGNSGNIVWVPSGGNATAAYPSVTNDGGATWTECLFNGTKLSTLTAHPLYLYNQYTYQRICVAADKTTPGTFYLFIYGTSPTDAPTDATWAGVWKTTDGGFNFSRTHAGIFSSAIGSASDFYNAKLKMVHGFTGQMIFCSGDDSVNDVAANLPLQLSTDGGITFTAIAGLYEPEDFCIGAPMPGRSVPTVYAYGYSATADNTTRGVFRSLDAISNPAGATWTKINVPWVLGNYDSGTIMGAHPSDSFGRFYLGKGGSGAMIVDYADAAGVT